MGLFDAIRSFSERNRYVSSPQQLAELIKKSLEMTSEEAPYLVVPLASLPNDGNLIETLYRFLLNTSKEHIRERGTIWVTDILYCPLKCYYSLRFPEIQQARLIVNPQLFHGLLVHIGLEVLARLCGFEVEKRLEMNIGIENTYPESELTKLLGIEKQVKLVGRADLYDPANNIVYEIKTVKEVKNVLPQHVIQAWIYKEILKADKAKLIYIAGNGCFEIDVNDNMVVDALNKLGVRGALDDFVGTISNMIESWLSLERVPLWEWECNVCEFKGICSKRR